MNKKTYKETDSERGIHYIGVSVTFFCHDGKGKYLLHKRSENCRDEIGRWDPGGGSMEHGESFEKAVRREVLEEYSTEIENLKYVGLFNVLRKNKGIKTHWITIVFKAKVNPKEVKIGEPEKMDELGWFEEGKWPSPLHSKFKEIWETIKND